ncbi:hypothetical protein MMC27_007065 [Xylographa pallens]|nr:hypothetical protein [Xylographa pallens]
MDAPHLSIDEVSRRATSSGSKADDTSSSFGLQSLSYGNVSTKETQTLDDIFADLHPEAPLPVLMRATNGKPKDENSEKIKLSTIVQPDALEAFFIRYAEVWKSGMHGLRKRDRSGRKKAKAKKRKVGGDGEKKV